MALVVFASACATSRPGFVVITDVSGPGAMVARGRFIILPGLALVDASDARFREVRGYVTRALRSQGLRPAATIDEADVAVLLRFGVGPRQVATIARPLPPIAWGRLVSPPSLLDKAGLPDTLPFPVPAADVAPIPDFDAVRSRSDTTYRRWLELEAVDAASVRRDGTGRALWRKTVTSVGRSHDLGVVMPYLVVSLEPYLGRDMRRAVRVVVDQHDRRVKALREP
jgi:hypothetical protein